MNNEDFVTYIQALDLKKLGFREECFYYYTHQQLMPNKYLNKYGLKTIPAYYLCKSVNDENLDNNICDAPTLWQAQSWLRKEKRLHINPIYFEEYSWNVIVYNMEDDNKNMLFNHLYPSYEEALSAGITECIEFLTTKQK